MDTAFIDRRRQKQYQTAIVRQISTLTRSNLKTYPINRVKEIKRPARIIPQINSGDKTIVAQALGKNNIKHDP